VEDTGDEPGKKRGIVFSPLDCSDTCLRSHGTKNGMHA
jgi:hypothetical protein